MTIEQMRERKRELGYSYQKIAQLSGLPVGTVQKVLGGITRSPREETVGALERVLKTKATVLGEEREKTTEISLDDERDKVVREKKPGEYTLEDYYVLSHERNVELIDGVFYDKESPTSVHQITLLEIGAQLSFYMKGAGHKGAIIVSPMDVQLDGNDRTMVCPDLFVVCDRGKVGQRVVYGVPDFVIEITSPTSRRMDMSIKLSKYSEAGVREYWLIDPDKKRVLVYPLEQEELPVMYDFHGQVPVGIFDGELCVDFTEIDRFLADI